MDRLIRTIIASILTVTLTLFNPFVVNADVSSVTYKSGFTLKSEQRLQAQETLNQAEAIMEAKSVIDASNNRIDELRDNRGIQIAYTTDSANLGTEIRTYFSTHLLESKVENGKVVDTYVANLLTVTGTLSYDLTDSKSGSTLLSRMYIKCREYNGAQQIKLLYTTATVSGSNSVLSMKNGARKSAIYNPIYATWGTPSPVGTYTLYPASGAASMWIQDSTGLAILENTIHLTSGGTVSTRFSVNPLFIQSVY